MKSRCHTMVTGSPAAGQIAVHTTIPAVSRVQYRIVSHVSNVGMERCKSCEYGDAKAAGLKGPPGAL